MLSELEKLEEMARLKKAEMIVAEKQLQKLKLAQQLAKLDEDLASQEAYIQEQKAKLGE
jgi:hypothetical protein